GPPLLLVHGWPQTWYAWRLVMPALARDFTVVAPDQRGTGIDANDGFSIGASPQLVRGGFNVIRLNASYHRELSMRNNAHPFTNKYVRQAIACTLDRPAIVQALFRGYAEVGNDTPFAPAFPAAIGPPVIPPAADQE